MRRESEVLGVADEGVILEAEGALDVGVGVAKCQSTKVSIA